MKKILKEIKKALSVLMVVFLILSVTTMAVDARPRWNHNASTSPDTGVSPDASTGTSVSSGTSTSTIKYGFWYDTVSPSSYQPNWASLTHVAYPFWTANSDGSLTPPSSINNYNAVKNAAHQHGVKVIIAVGSFNANTIDSILANHREEFANNVLKAVQTNGADGVNIDFEFPSNTNSITKTSNVPLVENLMSTLNTKLKSANPNYHISVDTSYYCEWVYCNPNLSKYLDSIFLMGYDFNWQAKQTAPNSPYNDATRSDVVDSVNILLKYYSPQKIILGVPTYGYNYGAASGNAGASITSKNTIEMRTAISDAQKYGRQWDSNSHTPWYRYQSGGTWHQVWYDDDESLGLKYSYVKSKNLGGIGFWALGFEGSNASIWNVIK